MTVTDTKRLQETKLLTDLDVLEQFVKPFTRIFVGIIESINAQEFAQTLMFYLTTFCVVYERVGRELSRSLYRAGVGAGTTPSVGVMLRTSVDGTAREESCV